MSKPVIAVDVDDVLADSAAAFVAFSNQRWGTNLTVDDYQDHWGDMWQLDHEATEARAQVWRTAGLIRQYAHKEAAADVLRQLQPDYRLIITTARPKIMEADTLAWLDEHYNGLFEDVHFANFFGSNDYLAYHRTKGEMYRQLGANYVIDDQLKHCLSAAEIGLGAVIFGDYAWNRTDQPTPGVVRCLNWPAVQEYFNGLRG